MSDWPEVTFYRGQRVEDMARDDLVDAVKVLARMVQDGHERAMSLHEMYKTINASRAARYSL